MQIQKLFHNLSNKNNQNNNKEIENNVTSNMNFEKIAKINSYSDINKKENEKDIQNKIKEKQQIDFTDKNSINIRNEYINEIPINAPLNTSTLDMNKSNINMQDSKMISNNFFDINPNNKNNNNYINTNDDNFFNISFYNKENNKINNNNYNKKFDNIHSYNNGNKINNSELEIGIKNNNQLKSQINEELSSLSNVQNIEQRNNIINEQHSVFSYEKSDSNFRKKNRHKNHFKIRFGDWICPKCDNLNFSFRNKCNRCGLPKELQNNNNVQGDENNTNIQRPILLNNININYIFNSIFPINNINIVYNPIIINHNNINNYYGNYNNYQIYYPCNFNIK